MYRQIINDFLRGLCDSLRLDYFTNAIKLDNKIRSIVESIIRFNTALYFLPHIILGFIGYLFRINLTFILYYIMYPFNLISVTMHIYFYANLISNLSVFTKLESKTFLDIISFTITMTIYRMGIYLTTKLAYVIFNPILHFFINVIMIFILSIYHSYNCFNNLWHYKKINLGEMVNLCEQSWPYYIGYGSIATVLYIFKYHPVITGLYNIQIALIISIPFLNKNTYPKKKPIYPKINLSLFSYITGYMMKIAKFIAIKLG